MRSSVANSRRNASPIRRDIVQICIGLVIAVFLFQADRTISAIGGGFPTSVASKDAMTASVQLAQLECGRVVAALSQFVRIGATHCHLTEIFK